MTIERTLLDKFRDRTGIGYDGLTQAFEPSFTDQVATWPVIAIFPLEAPPLPDALVASLLRRDLAFAGAISVLGIEDTPKQTHDELFEELRESSEPIPWNLVAGVGCELREGRLVLHGRLTRVDRVDATERFSVEGPVEQLAALTVQLVERFAEALQLTPSARARELWSQGRPVSWENLLACGRAWAEDDVAWLEAGLVRGEVHPDALVMADDDTNEPALVRRAVVLACTKDPSNPQLCFNHFSRLWKGMGRDSAAARVLRQGLSAAPGHGKSQMCLAHMFQRDPWNAEHILAHAHAGYRLLRGNSFAMSNFMNYLNQFAPRDPRRGPLMEEMLETNPYHPDVLKQAMDFFIEDGQPRRALELALHYKKLCTDPIHPTTLYCFRQNPMRAAEIESGAFKPFDDALRCVGICEKAVRKSEQG
ncbi:hypothetical protein F0U61_27110 [Archangium violaceum]|uniref:hypothetical protein n=1 Tax=Archangium violaceum TaxID=83451 RepID=UPI002B2EC565|nr:hypothetical protein F0U61_27110 [Archangium violaceum]